MRVTLWPPWFWSILAPLVVALVVAAWWWLPILMVNRAVHTSLTSAAPSATAPQSQLGLTSADRAKLENDYRVTLTQTIGGAVLVAGVVFTWKNIQTTREGQITERFTRAIEQLGSEKAEVRIGGIYALERITRDSPRDQWPIIETLTAYIRDQSRRQEPTPSAELRAPDSEAGEMVTPKLSTDIQAALTVIGRRNPNHDQVKEVLDLRRSYLPGASLRDAFLQRADLRDAFLQRADLRNTRLDGAQLRRADLQRADLSGAVLRAASLRRARLRHSSLEHTDLRLADLENADLSYASLVGADLSDVSGLTQVQIEGAVGDEQTKLPDGVVIQGRTESAAATDSPTSRQ